MSRTKHLYVSLLVLALAVAFQVISYELPEKSRMMPTLVGWIAIVLCVLDVIAQTETAVGRWTAQVLSGPVQQVEKEKPGPGLGAELTAFFWIIAATAGVIVFGFLWTIPVYVFVYTVIRGRKSLMLSAFTALCVTLSIWVAFELLLEYEIYRGLLFSDL